jgi:hypothetical protein
MKCAKFKNIVEAIQKTTNLMIQGSASCPMMRNPQRLFKGPAPKSPPNPWVHHWAI